jgi:predicted O-methyltransferase YrrM
MLPEEIIFLLLALLIGLLIFGLWYLKKRFNQLTLRQIRVERSVWESVALNSMFDGQSLLPRPGGWAASTDILYEMVRIVQVSQPRLIVELGSGLSTILLAKAASKCGGKIISIDHDAQYAQQTRREIERRGLQDYVEFRVAPLKVQDIQQESREWYDIAVLSDLSDVDLIFVDGPPAKVRKDIRKPSLPYFWDKLSAGGRLIMDDAARPAERKMIRDWKKQFPQASFIKRKAEKGAVIVEK